MARRVVPLRARRLARRLLGSIPRRTGTGASGLNPTKLPAKRYALPAGEWPEPPTTEKPNAYDSDRGPVPVYDLALFEQLNAEYADHPVVTSWPLYDHASLMTRSRQRLSGIHQRIGLAGYRVLEVGCGAGYEVWSLANGLGCDAWGIDITPRAAWPALAGDRVHLVAGDIADASGLEPGSFDRVISFTVWEHITRPEAALEQVWELLRPGGVAWIRANLHRGPVASHLYRNVRFPFPHLLFQDDVIAAGMGRMGATPVPAAWVNRLTWEQYEAILRRLGFRIRALAFDTRPLDEAFYARFEDLLGRYPRRDLERNYFTVVIEKPRSRGRGPFSARPPRPVGAGATPS